MRIITCFSYKGGAGRTVAAANIAAALASAEVKGAITEPLNAKVAILDLDVFSAGTHRAFDISNKDLETARPVIPMIQDYLLRLTKASDYVAAGGITLEHKLMATFLTRGAAERPANAPIRWHCRPDLTLFPAKPGADKDSRFTVQKYQHNQLVGLISELERQNFDYLIIDGEAGVRALAEIALQEADVVLMFFRLTWQHIEGTLRVADEIPKDQKSHRPKPCYLIPTCVPLAGVQEGIYQPAAPGRNFLEINTTRIPASSEGLNERADANPQTLGYFWAHPTGRRCVHDSLYLKGAECVLVYDDLIQQDPTAADFYFIAKELRRLHPPG
jgi:cellulose biosynthesis protein BcsQ